MLSMRLLTRSNLSHYAVTTQRLHTSRLLYDSSDSSSSDSDRNSSKRKSKVKRLQTDAEKLQADQQTTDRLNSLLERMITQSKAPEKLNLSVPIKKTKKQRTQQEKSYEENLITAAKTVATTLGGDVQKTESELLNKLLSSEKSMHEKQEGSAPDSPLSISELLAGMKIERTPPKDTPSMPPQSFQAQTAAGKAIPMIRSKFRQARAATEKFESMRSERRNTTEQAQRGLPQPSNLYNAQISEIFDVVAKEPSPDIPELTTWKSLETKEFRLALTHPPENIFQEMIRWTEEGKLWKFPIDNEQGMEEEQNVHFSEHVFMERHLQDWCPKRGPIRHFMELVCVGLSKNPYMTVKEKKEHIAWYHEYFSTKQELLRELGAVEAEIPLQRKQIEA